MEDGLIYQYENKIRVIVLLPYIRNLDGLTLGNLYFSGIKELQNESKSIQDDLLRIISFFRERENYYIQYFSYLIIDGNKLEIDQKITEIRKNIEIFRYFTVNPKRHGLSSEHTTVYLIYPRKDNPWVHENEEYFHYSIYEDFSENEHFVTYPHSRHKPPFIKEIHGETPPSIDEKYKKILEEKINDNDLRALTWYNKTFSYSAYDKKENLLRLSVAFESHYSLSESEGKKTVRSTIELLIKEYLINNNLELVLDKLEPFLISKIVERLSLKILDDTGSEKIRKWFKTHFYSVGSGIRHGDEIAEIPRSVPSKKNNGLSVYYSGGASFEYLNNIYFAKRLFKYIFDEFYFPSSEFVKDFEVKYLEDLLVADEKRLEQLEQIVLGKKLGDITFQDINIISSLNWTYSGDKYKILTILKRLLSELKTEGDKWTKLAISGEILLNENLNSEDFKDYEKTKPFYNAIIELNSIFHSESLPIAISEKDLKYFAIKEFCNYALQRFI